MLAKSCCHPLLSDKFWTPPVENAVRNMQHLQQLQPRHALAQPKSDHLLDFLSQHMRPQSCWLSQVVIPLLSDTFWTLWWKRQHKHATSATTTAKTCTSSTQVRHKEIRPSVGFFISAYAPSVMLAKSSRHPLVSDTFWTLWWKRQHKHPTFATTAAKTCTSSTQVRHKEIRPSVGFFISAYAPSVMLAKSSRHPLLSDTFWTVVEKANTNMQHLQQLQPRHALAQPK